MAKYEVVLSLAAKRAVWGLRRVHDQDDLADCLRRELDHGPNADREYVFMVERQSYSYIATPLTFRAWTAVHRQLTRQELDRLEDEQNRRVEQFGFVIHDFLRPHSAFELGPHSYL